MPPTLWEFFKGTWKMYLPLAGWYWFLKGSQDRTLIYGVKMPFAWMVGYAFYQLASVKALRFITDLWGLT